MSDMFMGGKKWEPKVADGAAVRTPSRRGILGYRAYLLTKRIFDALFALAALVMGAPVLALVMAVIRVTSPGPVFFSQVRIGKNGKPFTIFKFRTMHADTPKYSTTPRDDGMDPRVTPIGRVLRKSGLDEVPQLYNVLRGDMSLVGPRPEMPFLVEKYTDKQRRRLSVRPGVTGLWQISADRTKPIHENLHHDLHYIDNQSFLMDLRIILDTVFYTIRAIRRALG